MFFDSGALTFLAIMGLPFIVFPFVVILWKLVFRIGCKTAKGTCIRIDKIYDKEAESTSIHPIIEFMTFKGERIEFKSNTGYGLKYMTQVGDIVKIYYKTDNPHRAQVASKGLWEVSGILMLAGVAMVLPFIVAAFFGA